MTNSPEYEQGFSAGIVTALAVLTSFGDVGSTEYEAILNAAGRDDVIAYARTAKAMTWSGLARYLGEPGDA